MASSNDGATFGRAMLRKLMQLASIGAILSNAHLFTAAPPAVDCVVTDSRGRCLVEALDPARNKSATTSSTSSQADEHRPQTGQQAASEQSRERRQVNAAARIADKAAATTRCQLIPRATDCAPPTVQVPAPTAVPQQRIPAPSVGQVAQIAVKELPFTAPSVHLSVDDQAFVGVPVWLWIDRGTGAAGPLSATASAGAAR